MGIWCATRLHKNALPKNLHCVFYTSKINQDVVVLYYVAEPFMWYFSRRALSPLWNEIELTYTHRHAETITRLQVGRLWHRPTLTLTRYLAAVSCSNLYRQFPHCTSASGILLVSLWLGGSSWRLHSRQEGAGWKCFRQSWTDSLFLLLWQKNLWWRNPLGKEEDQSCSLGICLAKLPVKMCLFSLHSWSGT